MSDTSLHLLVDGDGRCLTITVDEVARRLGVSRGLAYRQIREGKLPCVRVGRRVVVPVDAFEEYMAKSGAR